jgi:hypothetical protein
VLIEIAQHVWIAGTTSFYITSGIDMQAPPGSSTEKIIHVLLIRVLAGEKRFGKPKPKPLVGAGFYVLFPLKSRHVCACLTYITTFEGF